MTIEKHVKVSHHTTERSAQKRHSSRDRAAQVCTRQPQCFVGDAAVVGISHSRHRLSRCCQLIHIHCRVIVLRQGLDVLLNGMRCCFCVVLAGQGKGA
jgi:hypothetical protein